MVKGLNGVVVSDGFSVIATDKNGKYELELHPNAVAVFVSTPAGYAFNHEKGLIPPLPTWYRTLTNAKRINFELDPLTTDDTNHQFIIWADPQVKTEKDVQPHDGGICARCTEIAYRPPMALCCMV